MTALYNYIQTFFGDYEAVNKSPEFMVTSIDLFFKSKPYADNNTSGASKPQVTMWLCEIDNNVPNPDKKIKDSTTWADWDEIACSTNATASTTFSFRNPVLLKSNTPYGIVLKFQDSGFILWENVRGDALVRETGTTQIASTGSQSTTDGSLFKSVSPGSDAIRYADRDLKYEIKVAKFTGANTTVYVVNKDYEFFTINTIVGGFIPGEVVYKQTANATGNIAFSSSNNYVRGTGTIFQNMYEGQQIIIDNGSANDSVTVKSIVSNTEMYIERPVNFEGPGNYKSPVAGRVFKYSAPSKTLHLVDSNASNSTFKFAAGDTLVGERSGTTANLVSLDRYSVDSFVPKFTLNGPVAGAFELSYKIATGANTLQSAYTSFSLNDINRVGQVSYILSRSQEVEGSSLYGTDKKSIVAKIDLQLTGTGNAFTAPFIDCDDLDLIVKKHEVNNTYLEDRVYVSSANTSYSYTIEDYDTEIDRNGLADSKYISKKVTYAPGVYAEDLKVFLAAYRPVGTEVRVYAKMHNSADVEPFDIKAWTPLVLEQNNAKYSAENDISDLIEYTYGLPQYPEMMSAHGESNLAEYGNTVILTPSSLVSVIQEDDLIRIYKPDFAETNHEVYSVISSNTTAIVVNRAIRNTDIVNGLGQPAVAVGIEKLKYKNIAFNNLANDNVARYYTSSRTEFDNFNTMQIKIVLLSDASNKNPRVEQIQAVGVSA
jgi:hypothetical protein